MAREFATTQRRPAPPAKGEVVAKKDAAADTNAGALQAPVSVDESKSADSPEPVVHELSAGKDAEPEVEHLPTVEDSDPAQGNQEPQGAPEGMQTASADGSGEPQGRLGSFDDLAAEAQPAQRSDPPPPPDNGAQGGRTAMSAGAGAAGAEAAQEEPEIEEITHPVTFPDESNDIEETRLPLTMGDPPASDNPGGDGTPMSELIDTPLRESSADASPMASSLIDTPLGEAGGPRSAFGGIPTAAAFASIGPMTARTRQAVGAIRGAIGAPAVERFFFMAAGIRFSVAEYTARQAFSSPFEVDLVLALDEGYPVDAVLGAGGTLISDHGSGETYINGIVNRLEETGVRGRYRMFRAQLVPQLWLLGLTHQCRIFQDKTVVEIISDVLEGSGIPSDAYEFRTRNNYARRPYCVQYRETNLAFISRLAEEEGIYYFFEHEDRHHTIVFGEAALAYQWIDGEPLVEFHPGEGLAPEKEVVLEFGLTRQLQPNRVLLRDFDFTRPRLVMQAEREETAPEQEERPQRQYEWYDYPGRYDESERGNRFAAIRLQEHLQYREVASGRSTCNRFQPGYMFELDCHDCDGANQAYVLTEVVHEGRQPQVLEESTATGEGFSYINRFAVLPANMGFAPRRVTPRPTIAGVQTAMVTGPENETIYTDSYGRVKVRFHWDRGITREENASCWIRVGQLWAGPDWGAMFIPRVGQEVMVGFEEGNPDRPIIVGRVYDGDNMPPYTLPEEKTKSTIKSQSVDADGFNELRFEDRAGSEEIFIHAQKDFNTVVENDMDTHVMHDQSLAIDNDRTKTVQGNETNETQGDRTSRINGDDTCQVGGSSTVQAGGNVSVNATNDIRTTSTILRLHASDTIELRAGSSCIRLSASGIEITGATITSTSAGPNELNGVPVMINC